jgi:predicted outer membrane repeat protein
MINSTLSGNSAFANGGGILAAGTLNLYNTLIANSPVGTDCYKYGTVAGDHNLIETDSENANSCGTTSPINNDPLLDGVLAYNSGDTKTLALLDGSRAIDSGNQAICTEFDQRGFPRSLDGENDGTEICDIGAFEYKYEAKNYLPMVIK